MNKAPDTRGKLDSNAGIKKRKKKENKFSMSEFKEVAPLVKLGVAPKKAERKPKKLTKGQIFKQQHGYSKSMLRAMRRAGLDPMAYSDSLNEYRALRKKRRKEAKAAKRKPIGNVKVVEPIKAKKKK